MKHFIKIGKKQIEVEIVEVRMQYGRKRYLVKILPGQEVVVEKLIKKRYVKN